MPLNVNMFVSVMEVNKGFFSAAPKHVTPMTEVRRSNKPNMTNIRQNIDHLLNLVTSGFCLFMTMAKSALQFSMFMTNN
jgi:DNA-binding cell septation regulator SpoVG